MIVEDPIPLTAKDTPEGVAVDLTLCPLCERPSSDIAVRHRNTSYCEERLNFLTSCGDCYRRDYDEFQERWVEYYRGCL